MAELVASGLVVPDATPERFGGSPLKDTERERGSTGISSSWTA